MVPSALVRRLVMGRMLQDWPRSITPTQCLSCLLHRMQGDGGSEANYYELLGVEPDCSMDDIKVIVCGVRVWLRGSHGMR